MRGLGLRLEEAMAGRYEGTVAMVKSQDFIEGPLAFSQKRPPKWQGK
jgi:enoyl-CoA hydratase/carnithine racemase